MKVGSSWIVMSVLALVAVGLAFGQSIKTDGNIETDGQFVSNEPTLPPLLVSSSATVTGLSADLVDGLDSSDFAGAVHFHDDLYFTEMELSTSFGGGVVHWDNVTSVPADLADGDDVFTLADGPCFDDLNRYVDCGNGTVTDTVTGLIWLEDASCVTLPGLGGLETGTYAAANDAAALLADGTCGLTDNSNPGEWRLPTKAEWDATVARAVAMANACASPSLTDTEGTGCFVGGSGNQPFSGVQSSIVSIYWSSSAHEVNPGRAWLVGLFNGVTGSGIKPLDGFVWPVRGQP